MIHSMSMYILAVVRIGTFLSLAALAGSMRVSGESTTAPEIPPTPRVLLLGIDGVHLAALPEADTPHLELLLRNGVRSPLDALKWKTPGGGRAESLRPVAWRALLTGTRPVTPRVADQLMDANFLRRLPSLFHLVDEAWGQGSTICLSAWAEPPRGLMPNTTIIRRFEASGSMMDEDAMVTREAQRLLKAEDPRFLVVLYDQVASLPPETDAEGYREALEQLDKRIGTVLTTLIERPGFAGENWLIMALNTLAGSHPGIPFSLESFALTYGKSIPSDELSKVDAPGALAPIILNHLDLDVPASMAPQDQGGAEVARLESEYQWRRLATGMIDSLEVLQRSTQDALGRLMQAQQEAEASRSRQMTNILSQYSTALNQRLDQVKEDWAKERDRELDMIHKSNQITLMVVVTVFAVAFLGSLYSMWIQSRAMRHLGVIVSGLPRRSDWHALPHGHDWEESGPAEAPSGLPPSTNLQNAVERLEHRLGSLEETFHTQTEDLEPESEPEESKTHQSGRRKTKRRISVAGK